MVRNEKQFGYGGITTTLAGRSTQLFRTFIMQQKDCENLRSPSHHGNSYIFRFLSGISANLL